MTTPLRILVISNLYPPQVLGGYERSIADFSRLLQHRGHEVLVLTSDASQYSASHISQYADPTVDRCLTLMAEWSATGTQWLEHDRVMILNQQNQHTLQQQIQAFQPHICLAGNLGGLQVKTEILEVLLGAQIPVAHYVMNGSPGYAWELTPQRSTFCFLTCSNWLTRKLASSNYPTHSTRTIYPGADVEAFYQAELPPRDRLRIAYASLVAPYKGTDVLIEALSLLHDAGVEFEATIAGGTFVPEFAEALKEFVAAEGMQSKVQFTGVLSRQELMELYKTHNVLAFPSRFEEPFGISQIEAMAAGLTLVTSGTGGAGEIVAVSGQDGLLFESENPLDLADVLAALPADPERWGTIAANGQQRALTEFSQTKAVEQLEQALLDLILQQSSPTVQSPQRVPSSAVFVPTLKAKGYLDDTHITVAIVGSRKLLEEDDYGNAGWDLFAPQLTIYGFDADAEACEAENADLLARGINWTERHIPIALGNSQGRSTLYITGHPACTSLYPPNEPCTARFAGFEASMKLVSTVEIETTTLDEFCQSEGIQGIDFLQIDVQGADLDVLKGAAKLLDDSILGVLTEVEFVPLYINQPLFADVDVYMREQGFSLFDLITDNPWCRVTRSISPIQSKKRAGQLTWADACYFRDPLQPNADPALKQPDQILKLACIADVLDFPDYALELLQHLTVEYGGNPKYNFSELISECLAHLSTPVKLEVDSEKAADPSAIQAAELMTRDYKVGSFSIALPLNHSLERYQSVWKRYDTALGMIAQVVFQKYSQASAIDIGANVGDSAALIRTYTEAPILCVEGNPEFLPYLHHNALRIGKIEIESCFVGTQGEKINLEEIISEGGTSTIVKAVSSSEEGVPTKTLEAIIQSRSSFQTAKLLKIDTDGFDFPIIQASREIISQLQPIVFFEYDVAFTPDGASQGLSTIDTLREIGYKYFIVYDNFGNYLTGLSSHDRDRFIDLTAYLKSNRQKSGTPAVYYFDICAFSAENVDLYETIRNHEIN